MTARAGSAQAARPIRLAVNTLSMAGILRQGAELGSVGSERLAGSLWMVRRARSQPGRAQKRFNPGRALSAADLMTIDLAGSERVRRLPRRHP